MEHNYTPKEILHAWNHRKYLSGQTKTKTEANLIAFLDALPTRSALPAPPPGRRWHREDWTQDMLPEGWRPHLLNESDTPGDQLLNRQGIWEEVTMTGPTLEWHRHRRTRRPLPAEASAEPEQAAEEKPCGLNSALDEWSADDGPQAVSKEAPDTFEAHGKTWTRHTPGDPMPCDGEAIVQVIFPRELDDLDEWEDEALLAKAYDWGVETCEKYPIIGWRYADEPAQAQQAETQPWTPENAKAFEEFQGELRETWEAQPTQSQQAWTPRPGDVVLAQAVRRMEAVPVREMLDILAEARGDGLYSLDRVRASLIAAAKGEGQAQEVPQAEAKAEPATFEAHGKTWTRHMPGDPCPCDPRASVYVAFKDGTFSGRPGLAVNWAWGTYLPDSEWLIGWRYADEPAKAEAKAFSWADAVPENPAVTEQRKIRQAYDTSKQPAQPTQSQQAWTPAVGDVVRLRSGGPVMTVMDAEGKGEFWCLWFDPCGNKEAMDFPAACLTPAKEGQP